MNPIKIYTTLARYADNSIQWLQVLSRVSRALATESPEQASQPPAPQGKPVIVPSTMTPEEANQKYGEAFGVDWAYPEMPKLVPEPEKPKTGRGRPRKTEPVVEPEVIITKAEEIEALPVVQPSPELAKEMQENIAAAAKCFAEAADIVSAVIPTSVHTVDSLKLLIKPLTSANADVRTELKETLLKYSESLSTMAPEQHPLFVADIENLLKKHNLK